MAWPTTAVATGDLITAAQLNGLPVMLANTTLSADTASIAFSSIPQVYAHLLVEVYARTDQAVSLSIFAVRINGYGGATDYDSQRLQGSAATATAAEVLGATYHYVGLLPANNAGANLFGAATIEIPHYSQATNQKSIISTGVAKYGTASGNLYAYAHAGWLRNNEAVSTITLLSSSGNLKSGSRATLYGLP